MSTAISIEGLSKKFRLYHEKNQYLKTAILRGGRARYDDLWAVKDVSFEIPTGSTFGLIGSNGSGKSTLLKCLAGILTPDEGRVTTNGRMSALLELGAGFHPDLSGTENIFLNGAILGMTTKEIKSKFDDIVDFADISAFIDSPVKNYSSGMVVRLGFAIAANVDPEILIIDEVLAVGDEQFQQKCAEKIEQFRRDGRTIVLVSHGLAQVNQLCNKVAWMDKGHLRMLGDAYDVVQEYSGVSHEAVADTESGIGERWGSGEARITSVELLDEVGNPQKTLRTGQQCSIRINYESDIELVNPVFGVRIAQTQGVLIWGSTTRFEGVAIPQIHGTGSVTIDISEVPLLNGSYFLSVAIVDYAQVHAYDYWQDRIRLEINQGSIRTLGVVNVDHRWVVS